MGSVCSLEREPRQFISTAGGDAEAVERLNQLFADAVRCRASDIHIESKDNGDAYIRYRVGGTMRIIDEVPRHLATQMANKIRMKAKMPLSDRDRPLDGKITLEVDGRLVDLRVSIVPTLGGESVVCRILDTANRGFSIDDINMEPEVRQAVIHAVSHTEGIVLATGPTGSGKTTTLSGLLNHLNSPERKIITIEDPVEYRIPMACQIPVTQGTTFARALRAVLRQDPDIILVGEIRDAETAKTAIQAAMTGHFVLSTLHANDIPTTLIRLMDLALGNMDDTFVIEVTLKGIINQRLVRRICPHCRTEHVPTPQERLYLEKHVDVWAGMFPAPKLYRGAGCEACHGTGYDGRMSIVEFLGISSSMHPAIRSRNRMEILRCARKYVPYYRTLSEVGLIEALRGKTTLAEVWRVNFDGVETTEEEEEVAL